MKKETMNTGFCGHSPLWARAQRGPVDTQHWMDRQAPVEPQGGVQGGSAPVHSGSRVRSAEGPPGALVAAPVCDLA